MEFPANTHTQRDPSILRIAEEKSGSETPGVAEPKKLESVVTGIASKRKKPLGARFKDVFALDGVGFAEQLLKTIILPAAKEIAIDAFDNTVLNIKQSIEKALLGQVRTTSTRTVGTNGHTNYARMASNVTRITTGNPISRDRPSTPLRVARRSNVVEDIVCPSRGHALNIVEELDDMITRDGHCTVLDLYNAARLSHSSSDADWGWGDIGAHRILHTGPNEFLLRMPRPQPIEDE